MFITIESAAGGGGEGARKRGQSEDAQSDHENAPAPEKVGSPSSQ
jgi:hypothetical protein